MNKPPNDSWRAVADSSLAETEAFAEEHLSLLREYGLETVGDLLGATLGLTHVDWLRDVHDGLVERTNALRANLPKPLLDLHTQEQPPLSPMGWFPEEQDDDDA